MGHETANWGGRGLGYMLFNAHLCNQPYYWEVVVGPGTQLCTLLEVWVLRVGMSTLGRKRLCTSRIGDPQVPMTMEHPQCGFAAPGLILRQRFQIGMFRTIRLDHTNCLQVAIKTHSFIRSGVREEYVTNVSREGMCTVEVRQYIRTHEICVIPIRFGGSVLQSEVL